MTILIEEGNINPLKGLNFFYVLKLLLHRIQSFLHYISTMIIYFGSDLLSESAGGRPTMQVCQCMV